MAAGDTTQGRRYPDVEDPHKPHKRMEPAGYRRMGGVWHARVPNDPSSGGAASMARHEVTEHEDGTTTVSPSILVRSTWAGKPWEWHGYLERGIWREV